jgi:glycosyltransferase involved in cell wall biosynthesis
MAAKNLLQDTSLCAIVRDEIMNPAGGIRDFVACTVPYVENAIIVDTGSLDGTREALEELEAQYPNLKIFDKKWNGYADGRNFSIKKADTKHILALDADERIVRSNFGKLRSIMTKHNLPSYELPIIYLYWDGSTTEGGHNPRLFEKGLGKFGVSGGGPWEYLLDSNGNKIRSHMDSGITIKHFLSTDEGHNLKDREWYTSGTWKSGNAPSELPEHHKWKILNPRRAKFKGLIQL